MTRMFSPLKFKVLLILLFANAGFLFSQKATGKAKPKKKLEAVLKPASYDSSKTLEEQFTPENQYQFIGLQLLLPPVLHPEAGPVIFSEHSKVGKGNKDYTITGILQGDISEQLKQKNAANQCGSRYKDFNSSDWKGLKIYVVFILREDTKNDSLNNSPLYWIVCQSKEPPFSHSYFNSFISLPYYEKQKQVFQDQDVINLSDKSKWHCNQVTLLKRKNDEDQDSIYDVFCVLANSKGEQMQQRPPSEKYGRIFITEKEYNWLNNANRNEKEEMIKAENEKKEKHKGECIKKFGLHNGELIAQDKIEIGMTTEMCKMAWGAPWDISKTTTPSEKKEVWSYNWNYRLHFKNGTLVKIEH